jgi:hypothetical protein
MSEKLSRFYLTYVKKSIGLNCRTYLHCYVLKFKDLQSLIYKIVVLGCRDGVVILYLL